MDDVDHWLCSGRCRRGRQSVAVRIYHMLPHRRLVAGSDGRRRAPQGVAAGVGCGLVAAPVLGDRRRAAAFPTVPERHLLTWRHLPGELER